MSQVSDVDVPKIVEQSKDERRSSLRLGDIHKAVEKIVPARTPDPMNKLDLADAEKRLGRLVKSVEGRQALRNVLGYNFQFVGEDTGPAKPKVALLVPSHMAPMPETTENFARMVAYSRERCELVPMPSVSSSVVHWVRNDLLIRLYRSEQEFDYALFMDDDIVPEPDHLLRLLDHGKDIVAGACTVRQDPPLPNFRIFDAESMTYKTAFEWNGEGLMEIGGVGTGLMMISKKALERIGDYYLDCEFERKYMGMTKKVAKVMSAGRRANAEKTLNRWWFEFLKQPFGQGEFGEDISFCFKARECGIPVFVDTTVRPKHMGRYGYGLDDYKFYQEQVLRQEKASGGESLGQRATKEMEELIGSEA